MERSNKVKHLYPAISGRKKFIKKKFYRDSDIPITSSNNPWFNLQKPRRSNEILFN